MRYSFPPIATEVQSPKSKVQSLKSQVAALAGLLLVVSCANSSRGRERDDAASRVPATSREVRKESAHVLELLRVFDTSSDPSWSQASAELRKIGSPVVSEQVFSALDDVESSRPADRQKGLATLRRINEMVRLLSKLDTDDFAAWQAAREALTRMGPEGTARLAAALIIKMASGQRPYWAAKVLVDMGENAVEPLSVVLAQEHIDFLTKVQSANVLLEIGQPAESYLARAVRSGTEEERRSIVKALRKSSGLDRFGLLAQRLREDSSWMVRAQAIESLEAIGEPAASAVILEALRDTDPFVQKRACRALGTLGTAQELPTLDQKAREAKDEEWKGELEAAARQIRKRTRQ